MPPWWRSALWTRHLIAEDSYNIVDALSLWDHNNGSSCVSKDPIMDQIVAKPFISSGVAIAAVLCFLSAEIPAAADDEVAAPLPAGVKAVWDSDPSDVLQDAFLDAANRLEEFIRNPEVSIFMWMRFLTGQKLQALHRKHLGARMRDVRQEISLYRGSLPQASSEALAERLLGYEPSPSDAAMRAERKIHLQEALNSMKPLDREIVALRHFEQLTSHEAAQVLGIEEEAARKRYFRALKKLKDILSSMPGGLEED